MNISISDTILFNINISQSDLVVKIIGGSRTASIT